MVTVVNGNGYYKKVESLSIPKHTYLFISFIFVWLPSCIATLYERGRFLTAQYDVLVEWQ